MKIATVYFRLDIRYSLTDTCSSSKICEPKKTPRLCTSFERENATSPKIKDGISPYIGRPYTHSHSTLFLPIQTYTAYSTRIGKNKQTTSSISLPFWLATPILGLVNNMANLHCFVGWYFTSLLYHWLYQGTSSIF